MLCNLAGARADEIQYGFADMYLEAEGWRYQMCSQSSEGSYEPINWLLRIFPVAASDDSINHAPCTSGRGIARALRKSQFEDLMSVL